MKGRKWSTPGDRNEQSWCELPYSKWSINPLLRIARCPIHHQRGYVGEMPFPASRHRAAFWVSAFTKAGDAVGLNRGWRENHALSHGQGHEHRSVYIRADDIRRYGSTAGCRAIWLKQSTTEFKQRPTVAIGTEMAWLSPWLSNQYMCLRPVPLLTEMLKEEHRGEEEKVKYLLSIPVSTALGDGDGDVEDHGDVDRAMQVETEVGDAVFSKWLLRSRARKQQSYWTSLWFMEVTLAWRG